MSLLQLVAYGGQSHYLMGQIHLTESEIEYKNYISLCNNSSFEELKRKFSDFDPEINKYQAFNTICFRNTNTVESTIECINIMKSYIEYCENQYPNLVKEMTMNALLNLMKHGSNTFEKVKYLLNYLCEIVDDSMETNNYIDNFIDKLLVNCTSDFELYTYLISKYNNTNRTNMKKSLGKLLFDCENLEIFKDIVKRCPELNNLSKYEMLKKVCVNGNVNIAEYLLLDDKINIYENNNELFKKTCLARQVECAELLCKQNELNKESLYVYLIDVFDCVYYDAINYEIKDKNTYETIDKYEDDKSDYSDYSDDWN